jgi:hypothetical protein
MTVPSFIPRRQLEVIAAACQFFRIPLMALIPDLQAVMTLYGTTKTNRFATEPRHVMFIDVGSMYTKVYSGLFVYDNASDSSELVKIVQTSGEWSEHVGGYHFAKALASAKGISVGKAQKMLVRSTGDSFGDLFEKETRHLEEVIEKAIDVAQNVGPIDEVQLIGGASTLKFVVDTIKTVTNVTNRRDFNANEALALGGLIAALGTDESSPYVKTAVRPLPPMTVNLTCGDRQESYSVKGGNAMQYVNFHNLDQICEEIIVTADPATIPSGCDPVLTRYVSKQNITLEGPGPFNLTLLMAIPDPMVRSAEWCQGSTCQTIEVDPMNRIADQAESALQFINMYVDAQGNKQFRPKLAILLEKVNDKLRKINRPNVESPYQPTEEMKEALVGINAQFAKDAFASLDREQLKAIRITLEEIATAIHIPRK